MNILLIGGNGFIGSHLIDYFLKMGHKVRVFDIVHERFREPLSSVDYRICSLGNTQELYEALIDIDIVFHLASTSVPSSSNINILADINSNLISSINILDSMVRMKVERLVFFSSGGAVYGYPAASKINEDHPLEPVSSYGINKLSIEKYIMLYQRLYNIKPIIVRPSNPYGPRQGHYKAQGVISTFLRQSLSERKIVVYGDGESEKDYIFINDLARMVHHLCLSQETGLYNLGYGYGTTINRIIEVVQDITHIKLQVEYQDKKNYDIDNFVLDTTKLNNVLSENIILTSLEEGVSETWEWMNSNKQ